MNMISTYLFIFSSLLIFSLVSKGNETHVIMTETKHVYVHLWGSVCLPFPSSAPKAALLQVARKYVVR